MQAGRVQKSPTKKRNQPAKVKQEPQTPTSLEGDAEEGERWHAASPNPFETVFNHSFSDSMGYLESQDLETV